MDSSGAVRGIVTDPLRAPIPGATLRLLPTEPGSPAQLVVTGDDGRFAIRGVYPQQYVATVGTLELGTLTDTVRLERWRTGTVAIVIAPPAGC